MRKPVGTSARPPGSMRSSAPTAACRSNPEEPEVARDGSGRSSAPRRRAMRTRTLASPDMRAWLVAALGDRVRQRLLAREPDLAGRVDVDALREHLVALADHVGDLLHAPLREVRDVDQPVRAREDLDERAEV